MTFPLKDMGTSTPGTTRLDEPPEGQLPPSPPFIPNNVVRAANPLGEDTPEPVILQTPHHYARVLFNSLTGVTD